MQVMPTATNNSVPRHVIDRHAVELSPFTESEPHFMHPTYNRSAIAENTLSRIDDTCTTVDAMPDEYHRSDIRIRFIWVNRLEVITNTLTRCLATSNYFKFVSLQYHALIVRGLQSPRRPSNVSPMMRRSFLLSCVPLSVFRLCVCVFYL